MAAYPLKLRFIYTVLLLSGDVCSTRQNFYKLAKFQNLKCWNKMNSADEENNSKNIIPKDVPRSNIIKRETRSPEAFPKINVCKKFADCSLNENASVPICYCDKACKHFNDCCTSDLTLAYHNETSTLKNTERIKIAQCDTELFRKQFLPISNYLPSFGYYVISTCPETFPHNEIKQKCYTHEHVLQGAPVTGRDGLVYANMYCAMCNAMGDFFFWNFHFSLPLNTFGKCMYPFDYLDPNMTMMEKIGKTESDNCHGRFVPPENYPSPRICNTYELYLNNSLEDNQKCLAFTNPVSVKPEKQPRVFYRNIFCVPDSLEHNNIMCLKSKETIFKTFGKAITVIFQLRPPLKVSGNQVCMDDSEYFDPDSGLCCSDDMSCSPIRVVNFRFKIRSNIVTSGIVDSLSLRRTVFMFWYVLPKERYNLRYITAIHEVSCNHGNNLISNQCCAGYGQLDIYMEIEENADYIKTTSTKMQDILWSYTEIGVNSTINVKNYLGKKSKMVETSSKFQMCEGLRIERYVHTGSDLTEITNKFDMSRSGQVNGEIPLSFEAEVYVHEPSNSSTNITIQKLEIVYKGTIFHEKRPEDKGWPFQVIMTYVTMSISCLMLLGTIITYSCLKLSSSPPGQISQNMMGNILVSQLLFMSGIGATRFKSLCLIIGIVSHYLWISAFTWISVFIVRVTLMLRTIKCNPAYSITENLNLRDYLIGYTVPFLIVAPSVALDLCNCTPLNLTYSGEICFPSGYPGNMIVFTIPVLVSLVINMASFILACISLKYYNVTTPSFQISRSYIPLYIRLCVISACPWILGIIAEITDQNIVRYMYILLAGLHGFFVSLCFLVRKRIITAMRNSSENHQEMELS